MMKNIVLIAFLLTSISVYSQAVEYAYDAAGNRTQRKLVVLAPGGGSSSRLGQLPSEEPITEKLTNDSKLSIYPNPVKEQLNLKVDGSFVAYDIVLTDLTGKVFLTKTINESSTQLDFTTYPKGTYLLRTGTNNQFTEWKIIKQ
ncbi:MAG: T9SS type A sorting domain-containing protein [Flavobacteriales bacterium]|nr:MAG: T9SS type A sorting domain-containing protein [Flavobacteriales bacterium]